MQRIQHIGFEVPYMLNCTFCRESECKYHLPANVPLSYNAACASHVSWRYNPVQGSSAFSVIAATLSASNGHIHVYTHL